jgi:hypothetical protein
MGRYLVVANQTVAGSALAAAVQRRIDAGDAEFHVVVPATPLRDQAVMPTGPSPEEQAYALAAQRLELQLRQIRDSGGTADGEVGDPDAVVAVRDALARFPADEVIVSTLPERISRWLRTDLPRRIGRETGLHVEHVVSEPTPSA